ncbi:ubiquitin carboxyl-terminal hydrolase 2-like [Rhodamnia argentea]|uniref:Ubiquitin carboxyl-terminal hydrolase n=1 Tax=Rhodamnia argentea TaxID=178133 RepID=A0ABM3HKC2_9MYRT|nr:ubiquitin carboxyl-terminal hydrolase 2-like [Rhodamnia argentea]
MGKKAKKKGRTPIREKPVANHIQKTVPPQNVAENEIAKGHPVQNESKTCAHLEKGFDLNAFSVKIRSSELLKCEDCREGVADRRGNKGKGKQGKKKKGGASTNSKSESRAIWVCLECGHYACGGVGFPTTSQSHAVQHARQTHHPLAIQLEKPSLRWCFPCSAPIPIDKSQENGEQQDDPLAEAVKLIKGRFMQAPSVDIEDVWFGSGSVTSEVNLTSSVSSCSDGRGAYVVRGMANLGNTCFFNSVVQNLLALDRLKDYLGKLDTTVGPLTISLKKLFSEVKMENGVKNVINPRSLFGCICSKAPQFRGYQQHDSHELLRCLLDVLSAEEFDVKKQSKLPQEGGVPHNQNVTFVNAVFGGQISSTVCCVVCGYCSTVYEPFLDLSLPVPTKKSPPKKNQPISRAKKAKILPKKGSRIRPKINKDSESITAHSVSSASASAQSTTHPIDTVASSSDSRIETSSGSGAAVDDRVTFPPDHLAIKDHDNTPLSGKETDTIAASTEEFTWIDYLDPGVQIFQKELEQHAVPADDPAWLDYLDSQPSSSEINFYSQDNGCRQVQGDGVADVADHGSQKYHFLRDSVNEATDITEEISSRNSWEDETPLQVQDSEVLLLPYEENTSTTGDITREGVTCSMAYTQDESEFDGFGDMFNEPDVVYGPVAGPSLGGDNFQTNEVADSGLMAGNSSESDPGEVDNSDSPISIESCLTDFTKGELLSNDNAWDCEKCSKTLRQQQLESKKKKQENCVASLCTYGFETGSQIISADSSSVSFCPAEAQKFSNGSSENDDHSVDTNHKEVILQNGKLDIPCHVSSSDQATGSCAGHEPSCTGTIMGKLRQVNPVLATKCEMEIVDKEADSGAVKVKRDATKRVLIHKAPPILTIHLKRFSQDARGRLSKLNGHVIFRETIDLRPFMNTRGEEKEKCVYRLTGVVEHMGTMRGGHYVAYIRGGEKSKNGAGASVWYHASDAYVHEVTIEEVLRCEAYILFYEII